jgi:fatty acid-binding protein DegV
VLELAGGATSVLSSCATIEEAAVAMAELVSASEPPIRAAVGYAADAVRHAADALARRLAAVPHISVERYRVGPAVGAHTGGLSFGVFWWPDAGR